MRDLVNETSKLLEAGIHVEESDISVFENFGAGYAIPSSSGVAAMRMMASKEGIIIDPVYTGKTRIDRCSWSPRLSYYYISFHSLVFTACLW